MPVPQQIKLLVGPFRTGKMPVPQQIKLLVGPFRTGKMPVPQQIKLLVEQASCLLLKKVIGNGARCAIG